MKTFIIERTILGAGTMTAEELQTISKTSNAVISILGKPYHWIQSFITDDKIYCIHIAESEAVVRKHARLSKLAINTVAEVKAIIDPITGNHLRWWQLKPSTLTI